MRFISLIIMGSVLLFFGSCTKDHRKDIYEMYPQYKLIKVFSEKIKPQTGLVLSCFGVNCGLPQGYQKKNGIANFSASYFLHKTKKDVISVDEARCLVVSVAEGLLQDINSNVEVRPYLDVYPFTADLLKVSIYFVDENRIDLGQGVSEVYFARGTIEYECYHIREYVKEKKRYSAVGKHVIMHEESYTEAFDIVKKQECLMTFPKKITPKMRAN